jgi:hypothetical protein
MDGYPILASGETAVMVTPAIDDQHAQAALQILSTPDALLTLAIGGDHLPEGIAAIQAGLNNPVLRPHYAIVEAKRIGRRFGKRKGDTKKAVHLIDDCTVMSLSEIKHVATLLHQMGKGAGNSTGKELVKLLQDKVKDSGADEATTQLIQSL